MNKLLGLLALAIAGTTCQRHAPPVAAATQPEATLVATVQKAATSPKPDPAAAGRLAKAMLVLLRRYDLAPLWNDPHGTYQASPVLDGFIGKEHQRIGLVINTVRRDKVQPQVFWVTGKSRFKRTVTPFSGTITINKITDLVDEMVAPGESTDSTNYLYTASSTFRFKQLGAKLAGELSGQAFFDFMISGKGSVDMITTIMTNPNDTFPAKGCGLVLRGTWTNQATHQQKPVLLARDLFVIAPELFPDFGVGDRGTLVNPKYAKLGWNEAWENEEWWADTPKPSLSL